MKKGGQHEYRVAYADLPCERPWLFAEDDGALWFIVREHHSAADLEDAWAAFRQMAS